MPATSTSTPAEAFRSYAWDYFSLHADHRLRAFHFYILISTALIGAFAVMLKNSGQHAWMSLFGFLLVFFSFVFWKIDERTRTLVKNAEHALKFLEAEHQLPDLAGAPHPLCLFAREEAMSKLPAFPLVSGHFSYARCFRWVFVMFSLVGAAGAAAVLLI